MSLTSYVFIRNVAVHEWAERNTSYTARPCPTSSGTLVHRCGESPTGRRAAGRSLRRADRIAVAVAACLVVQFAVIERPLRSRHETARRYTHVVADEAELAGHVEYETGKLAEYVGDRTTVRSRTN